MRQKRQRGSRRAQTMVTAGVVRAMMVTALRSYRTAGLRKAGSQEMVRSTTQRCRPSRSRESRPIRE